MPAANRIAATTLKEQDCRRWIQQLVGTPRARGGGATRGRFVALHDAIRIRDQHFHNDKAVAPKFKAPFDKAQPFQTDSIRQVWSKTKKRAEEHPFRVHVDPPRASTPMRDAANALETVLAAGIEQGEKRRGVKLAGVLADGQLLHGFGVLSWELASDLWPEWEPEDVDDLPEDEDERKRYRAYDDADDEPAEDAPPRKRYRETEGALKERMRDARARSFPIVWGAPRADTVGFVLDDAPIPGFAVFVTVRNVGILEYRGELAKHGLGVSLIEGEKKLRVWTEQERPASGEPSDDPDSWGLEIRLGHVWTRDECYELVATVGTNDWTLVKSWLHGWGRPPFALAYADRENHPDPLYAYQPYLQGMFRTKPDVDYERTLGRFLAEQTALKRYWIELGEGGFMEDQRGEKVVLTENSMNSFALPPGAKLVSADVSIDPAFIQFLLLSREEHEDSKPDTGEVDIGASTAPHTAAQSIAQANTDVADMKGKQVDAVQVMLESWVHIMQVPAAKGGLGDAPVEVYGTEESAGKIVGVEPSKLAGMHIEASMLPASGSQQVAQAEYYRGLLADEKVPFGTRDYLEATGKENPDAVIESWIAENIELEIATRTAKEESARRMGGVYSLAAGGGIMDGNGTPQEPDAVLNAAGYQRAGPPPGTPPGVVSLDPSLPPVLPPLMPMQPAAGEMIPQGMPM